MVLWLWYAVTSISLGYELKDKYWIKQLNMLKDQIFIWDFYLILQKTEY